MTVQEVINIITTLVPKTCKVVDGRLQGGFDDWDSDAGKALKMAIEALEKQIPKKVEDFMERTEEFGGFYKLDFMCPTCNEATICQPYRPKYCKHCGQKLDWGD